MASVCGKRSLTSGNLRHLPYFHPLRREVLETKFVVVTPVVYLTFVCHHHYWVGKRTLIVPTHEAPIVSVYVDGVIYHPYDPTTQ